MPDSNISLKALVEMLTELLNKNPHMANWLVDKTGEYEYWNGEIVINEKYRDIDLK